MLYPAVVPDSAYECENFHSKPGGLTSSHLASIQHSVWELLLHGSKQHGLEMMSCTMLGQQ